MTVLKKIIHKYEGMSVASKATIWFMACTLIQKGLSFITTPIFARLLTTEQYGIYNVYGSWMQILIIFATLRLDYAVFNKGMSKYSEDRDGYTSSMLGFTTIVTSLMLILYCIFREWINSFTELSSVLMLTMFAELYVVSAVNFWSLRERYEFRYKAVVFYTLATAVASSGLGIVAVLLFEDGGAARILSNAVVYVFGGIIIGIIVFCRGKKFFEFEYVKFAMVFNMPLMLHYFSSYIIEQSDRIMIQKLESLSATALYSIAYTVGGLTKIVTGAISNTLIPLQYRWLEKKEFVTLGKNLVTLMFGVGGLAILVALAGPEVVLFFGGEEYVSAVYVIPPVAASVFFSFLYNIVANIEFYYGKNKYAMKISCVCAGINIVLNFILIPVFGYVAAAYTTLFSYIVFAVGHIVYVNYLFKKNEQYKGLNSKAFYAMGIGVTVCCVLVGFLYQSIVVRVLLVIGIMGVVVWKRKRLVEVLKKRNE